MTNRSVIETDRKTTTVGRHGDNSVPLSGTTRVGVFESGGEEKWRITAYHSRVSTISGEL